MYDYYDSSFDRAMSYLGTLIVILLFVGFMIWIFSIPTPIYKDRNPVATCETHRGLRQIIGDEYGSASEFFCNDGVKFSVSYKVGEK